MTDKEINKAIFTFIFDSDASKIFPPSFCKHIEESVQRHLNYIRDPSKTDYCNDVNAIRKAELWLVQADEISHNKYMSNILDIYNKGIKITVKHRAEEFVKAIGKWKE